MASWYSSWLPGLPSINFVLPSSLQGRFISFVLKKSLGHFLRPGQLDFRQIDSQIGSGFVQVNDLELDNEVCSSYWLPIFRAEAHLQAINALLSDLPVVLHDGHISSVVARVPWPNPLTSTLGFSLDSLHLTFHLLPLPINAAHSTSNLAESVAFAAESFIHDELTPQEGTALLDSFHPDLSLQSDDDQNIPGSLDTDPFLSAPEEVHQSDLDPAGVSIFATLIERLLARFEFDAVNTKITLVHPGNMSITASISDIRYETEDSSGSPGATSSGSSACQHRTVSITGLTLTARNLRRPPDSSSTQTPPSRERYLDKLQMSPSRDPSPLPHGSRPVSPASSSSSLDDDTQFLMSQSLAFLPPRQSSPTSSVASSMYQSAISAAPSHMDQQDCSPSSSRTTSPAPQAHVPLDDPSPPERHSEEHAEDAAIISFGLSSIMIRLTTHSPTSVRTKVLSVPPGDKGKDTENLQFSITLGVIACAFRAWHIRGMLVMSKSFEKQAPATTINPNTSTSGTLPFGFDLSIKVRGIILLIPVPSPLEQLESNLDTSLLEYFKRPLVPPSLPCGYFRLFIEGISASISSVLISEESSVLRKQKAGKRPSMNTSSLLSAHLSFADISLFSFYGISTTTPASSLFASPILLMDHELPNQYSSAHIHPVEEQRCPPLPVFEVMDWTDEKYHSHGVKLSLWRMKSKRKLNKATHPDIGSPTLESLDHPGDRHDASSATPSSPAISITAKKWIPTSPPSRQKKPPADQVEIQVVPLHLFVDFGKALSTERIIAFLDEAMGSDSLRNIPPTCGGVTTDESDGEDAETPPASPRARSARERERERRRLEKLVLDDLDDGIHYGADQLAGQTAFKYGRTQLQVEPFLLFPFTVSLVYLSLIVAAHYFPGLFPDNSQIRYDSNSDKMSAPR